MKANSNDHPGKYTSSRGKLFLNFNIIESEKTDESGTRTVYDYDYVEVKSKLRAESIRAIINNTYSVEDETALINNKLGGSPEYVAEYQEYQDFRASVKAIVDK